MVLKGVLYFFCLLEVLLKGGVGLVEVHVIDQFQLKFYNHIEDIVKKHDILEECVPAFGSLGHVHLILDTGDVLENHCTW